MRWQPRAGAARHRAGSCPVPRRAPQPGKVENLVSLRAQGLLLGADPRQAKENLPNLARSLAVQADEYVLEDRIAGENAGFLEGAHHAQIGDLVGTSAVQGLAPVEDLPGRGPEEPGDHVKGRGLAGAVGSNQPHHLALADLEAHAGERDQSAEAGLDALDRQGGIGAGGFGGHACRASAPPAPGVAGSTAPGPGPGPNRLRHQALSAGTMPSGKKNTMTIMSTP